MGTSSMMRHRLPASCLVLGSLICISNGVAGSALRMDSYGDSLPPGAILRLGTVRFRVEGCVSSVAVSRDGQWAAAGDSVGLVYLWDASSGRIVRQMQMQERWPKIFFSHDSKSLGARDGDGHIQIWSIGTGKVLGSFDRQFKDNDRRSEKMLVAAGGKELIAIPDLNDLVNIYDGNHADAKIVGEKLDDISIDVLELPGGKRLRQLMRNEAQTVFGGAAISPDGSQSGSRHPAHHQAAAKWSEHLAWFPIPEASAGVQVSQGRLGARRADFFASLMLWSSSSSSAFSAERRSSAQRSSLSISVSNHSPFFADRCASNSLCRRAVASVRQRRDRGRR